MRHDHLFPTTVLLLPFTQTALVHHFEILAIVHYPVGVQFSLHCLHVLTIKKLPLAAAVLKLSDDSVTAFPRVWRKDENIATSPNAAVLPDEDMARPAPTTKHLASYPSHKFQMVRPYMNNITPILPVNV